MATRLKAAFRNEILKAAIDDTIGKRVEGIRLAEKTIGDDIYEQYTSQAERDAIATLLELGYDLNQTSCISINANGYSMNVCMSESRVHPWFFRNRLVVTRELADRAIANDELCHAVIIERQVAEAKLDALLKSVTTFDRLAEIWPEGEAYWKPVFDREAGKGGLPAIQIKDINAALGIPKIA